MMTMATDRERMSEMTARLAAEGSEHGGASAAQVTLRTWRTVEKLAGDRTDLGFDLTRPPWPILQAVVADGAPLAPAVVLADLGPLSALRFALECETAADLVPSGGEVAQMLTSLALFAARKSENHLRSGATSWPWPNGFNHQ
jgi:hypothetical protein